MKLLIKDKLTAETRLLELPSQPTLHQLTLYVAGFYPISDFSFYYEPLSAYGIVHQKPLSTNAALQEYLIQHKDSELVKIYVKPVALTLSKSKLAQPVNPAPSYSKKRTPVKRKQSLSGELVQKIDELVQKKVQKYMQAFHRRQQDARIHHSSKQLNKNQISNILNEQLNSTRKTTTNFTDPFVLTYDDINTNAYGVIGGSVQRSRYQSCSEKPSIYQARSDKKEKTLELTSNTYKHEMLKKSGMSKKSRGKQTKSRGKKKTKQCRCESIGTAQMKLKRNQSLSSYGKFYHVENSMVKRQGVGKIKKQFMTENVIKKSRDRQISWRSSSQISHGFNNQEVSEFVYEDTEKMNKSNISEKEPQLLNTEYYSANLSSCSLLSHQSMMPMREKGKILMKMKQIFGEQHKSSIFKFIEKHQNLTQSQIIDKYISNQHYQ